MFLSTQKYLFMLDLNSANVSKFIEIKEYNGEEIYTTSYSYDVLGNLVGIVDEEGNEWVFEYDSLGRKVSDIDPDIGVSNYTYDLNGNLINEIRSHGGLIQDKNFIRSYNELGQLVNISLLNGTLVEEYVYDGNGERVKSYNPIKNETIYTPFKEFMQIRNSEGIFNYTYIYEGETLVARINPDGSKYFYHPDHLGSTSLITNEAGEVVEDNYYLPYGELVGESDEKRLYENKEFDSDVRQYFYNARYYDPYKSMFVQPDSIIPNVYDPQQLNRYAFERGNPYNFVDPSGHAITPIGLLGSSGIRQEIGTTLIKGYRNDLNYGDLNLPQMIGLKTYDLLLKSQIDVDYGINAELNNPIVEASPYYNTLDQARVREDVVYGLSSMALFVGGEVFGGTLSIVSYVDTGSSLISNKGIIEQTKDISNNFIDTSIKVFESIKGRLKND